MKYQHHILTLFCFAILLLSCKQTIPSLIYYEKSFEEMAQSAVAENKHFAIIISHPDCPPCGALHIRLFDEVSFAVGNKAIFNIVDITLPENKWYQQFIAAMVQPAALIFSSGAELKAIISGASRASTECIKSVIHGKTDCAQYYNRRFVTESITHENVINAFNLILTAKIKIENGQDATNELVESMQTLYYPYQLWLQIQNEQNNGNTENAVSIARQMLTFQSSMYAVLYSDLFLASRKAINPDFDIKSMPILEINVADIHLGDLQLDDKTDIQIKLKNTGKETLSILDINVGCSCLTLSSEISREIEPDNEEYLHLQFTAEHQGEITRRVMITTNGIEPVRFITIRTNVK
jgi:hypothetical protein